MRTRALSEAAETAGRFAAERDASREGEAYARQQLRQAQEQLEALQRQLERVSEALSY